MEPDPPPLHDPIDSADAGHQDDFLESGPSARLVEQSSPPSGHLWRSALGASAVAGFVAMPLVLLSTDVLARYGIALFLLGPFVLGAVANGILEWRGRYPIGTSVLVAVLSVL